ncbi:MAG: hypothetical protein Q8K72_04555, partial [Acidimicrobiales bacterium]|nr:hypothetical protein [Acidimicrobiales bacterium]
GLRLRSQRTLRQVLTTGGVVVVILAAIGLSVRANADRQATTVLSGGPLAPTTTLASAAGAASGDLGPPLVVTPLLPPSNPPPPVDGRLRRAYVPLGYRSDSPALSSFRVDPAPPNVAAQLSPAEALRAFQAHGEAASQTRQAGTTVTVRFGLFTGNVANPLEPGSNTLTGTHQVQEVPAWLVLIDGVRTAGSGGGAGGSSVSSADSGGVGTTLATVTTAAPPSNLVTGYAVTVISDGGGRLLTGLMITGGSVSQLGLD